MDYTVHGVAKSWTRLSSFHFVISFISFSHQQEKKACRFNLPFTTAGFKYLFIYLLSVFK